MAIAEQTIGSVTDAAIAAATKRRFGCTDVSILEYRHNRWDVWYLLSFKRCAGGEWELLCRRRTKAELLQFAEMAPQ